MILHGDFRFNRKLYKKGMEISPWKVYPFFLIHMLMFGGVSFVLAYFEPKPILLFFIGALATVFYICFYLVFFGLDTVKWLLINALLGVFGLYSEIGWLLSFAGKTIADYPWYIHIVPFTYYVLYTFLLRRFILDLTGVGHDKARSERISYYYAGISFAVYGVFYLT